MICFRRSFACHDIYFYALLPKIFRKYINIWKLLYTYGKITERYDKVAKILKHFPEFFVHPVKMAAERHTAGSGEYGSTGGWIRDGVQ